MQIYLSCLARNVACVVKETRPESRDGRWRQQSERPIDGIRRDVIERSVRDRLSKPQAGDVVGRRLGTA